VNQAVEHLPSKTRPWVENLVPPKKEKKRFLKDYIIKNSLKYNQTGMYVIEKSVILVLGRQRQEVYKFKASLSYGVRVCLKGEWYLPKYVWWLRELHTITCMEE
jgi:hypothetical protein